MRHPKHLLNLKNYLDMKVELYNNRGFICSDPISIPHQFSKKEDIEIAAFLTAIISWGRREQIIKSANKLMDLMDYSPGEFIHSACETDIKTLNSYYYRTFQGDDILFLFYALRDVYRKNGGLENIFNTSFNHSKSIKHSILSIRNTLLLTPHLRRSEKHLANPEKGSAAKRINMFLRWMIRQDDNGVDFGIWKSIPQSALMCPLDIHSGNIARKLGLLIRKQNDWKAVEELTDNLRQLDKVDPIKYDYALFGIGAFEENKLS